MERKLFKNAGDFLFFLTIVLLFIGSINIFSASFVMANQQFDNSYHFLIRHVVSIIAGSIAAYFLYKMDYRKIVQALPLWLGIIVLLLVFVLLFGIVVNGARRWLGPILGFQLQPSEFAKIAVILLAAWYSSFSYKKKMRPTVLYWPTAIVVLLFGLIYLQPDFGTGVLVLAFFLITLMIGGLSLIEIAGGGLFMLAGLAFIAIQAPYRLARLSNWWDPWEAQTSGGYQAVQSFLAIGSGGWHGMGGGQGISKFFYLPEAHTDFAFSVFAQEWGFIGICVVFFLFFFLLLAGVRIARQAVDPLGFCLAGGMTLFLVLQAFGNGMMVSGLLPVTGIPMPFFSYGGTFMLTNLIAIGFLLSIHRVTLKVQSEKTSRIPEEERNMRRSAYEKGR